jgi:hypothetical protein
VQAFALCRHCDERVPPERRLGRQRVAVARLPLVARDEDDGGEEPEAAEAEGELTRHV